MNMFSTERSIKRPLATRPFALIRSAEPTVLWEGLTYMYCSKQAQSTVFYSLFLYRLMMAMMHAYMLVKVLDISVILPYPVLFSH